MLGFADAAVSVQIQTQVELVSDSTGPVVDMLVG